MKLPKGVAPPPLDGDPPLLLVGVLLGAVGVVVGGGAAFGVVVGDGLGAGGAGGGGAGATFTGATDG